MPSDATTPSTENQPAPTSVPITLARLAAVSPHGLTPARFVDGFEEVFGIHSGFRRNHAKGICVGGFFDSNGQGTHLSRSVVFRTGRVPVVGRFSLGGGNPYVSDARDTIGGLGLLFRFARWSTVADSDDQSSGISVQHPAGLLRQVDCFATRPPIRINPIRKNWRRSWPAIPNLCGRQKSSKAMKCRPISTTALSTDSLPSASSSRPAS